MSGKVVQGIVTETGALWRIALAAPPANILDQTAIETLTGIFEAAREAPDLKAILLAADGPHFSFGASVAEHLPGRFETMIPAFHRLFYAMLDAEVFTVAAVNGMCLGGAMELASFCHRVFASPGARFSQPEMELAVFPPVASVFLADRVGRSRAEDLCVSGRRIDGAEAFRIGLVDELADDPNEAALGYIEKHLTSKSAAALRLGIRAVRLGLTERFRRQLEAVERIYCDELMATHDAVEGLEAFVAKRPPEWRNR